MARNFGNRLLLAIIYLLVSVVAPLTVWAQLPTTRGRIPLEDNQPHTAPIYTVPLGSAMEEYSYPFPVSYLSFDIEREPVRMAYMDVRPTANANGRTVVLLHGKNFYGSYWEQTIRALSQAGYRVVVPDQIGFGKSSKPDIRYSFDLLASNTARLLDELNIRQATIVGHSMGGMLAVRFARTFPERTTQLILENPIGLEDYRFAIPPQDFATLYQNEINQTPEAYRQFVRRYFVEWKTEYERFVEVRARIRLGGEFPRWARVSALTYQMIYQQPVRHEFNLISTPTLLIIGQEDRTVVGGNYVSEKVRRTLGQYPQLGQAAAGDIPNSRLIELKRVGHIPHLEATNEFNRVLLEFLR
ncbi:MAG: alpha/beta hydrolase [Pyrinomonadaceae bacterium]|nr:alpha/beta hydrolase [Pyrinomonadaceae bacterium]